MISQHKIQSKIIAVILIQAFLLLEVAWAAPEIARDASQNTLAPAISINQSDVQTVFSEESTQKSAGTIKRIRVGDMHQDDSMTSGATKEAGTAPNAQANSSSSSDNVVDLPSSVPPPENITLTVQLSNMVRNILPYPFTKKRLEEDIAKIGFAITSEVSLSRKQLVALLETLEQENFVRKLKNVGIKKIQYMPAIVQDGRVTDTAILTKQSGILTVTREFLKDELAVRIFLFREAINELTHSTRQLTFLDKHGDTQTQTAQERDLPPDAVEVIEAIEKIAFSYTWEQLNWSGIKEFMLYEPLGPAEFLRIPYHDDGILALSEEIIPDLIRLYKTSPSLFTELIKAGLAHEGGKSGHMKKWPIKIEDAIKIFNWPRLTKKAAGKLIRNLVDEKYTDIATLMQLGMPPLGLWAWSLDIIKKSLAHFGYDRNKPEPFGVIWKEEAAWYGMVRERGIRSAAVWFWFLQYFRGLTLDYDKEFRQMYNFLYENENNAGKPYDYRPEVIAEVEKIQKEYLKITKPKRTVGSFFKALISGNLMVGVLAFVITAVPFAVWGATSTGVTVVNLSTATFIIKTIVASFFIKTVVAVAVIGWLITVLMNRTSLEYRTASLFKRSINSNNLARFRSFYDRASSEKKVVIINTLLAMAQAKGKDKVISPEATEQVYLWALNDKAKEVRWTAAKAVREFAPYNGSASYMTALEKYLNDEDSQVAISVAYAFKLYAGSAPETLISMLEGLEEIETKMSASSVRALESKTTSVFQRSIKKDDLAAFRSFYEEAAAEEKVVIISKLLAMAQAQGKEKVISPEDTEQVYLWALDDTSKSVRSAGAKAVREFAPSSGSPYYRSSLEKFLVHNDFRVAGSVNFTLQRYGYTREDIAALIDQLESQIGAEPQSKMEVASKQSPTGRTNGKNIGPETVVAVDDKVSIRQRLLEPTRFIGQQDGLNTGLLKLIESAI